MYPSAREIVPYKAYQNDLNYEKWSKIDEIQKSADHHVTDQFRNKTIFFRDTRYHQEHGAKVRLSIPGPSPELALAEIAQLKENRPWRILHGPSIISS